MKYAIRIIQNGTTNYVSSTRMQLPALTPDIHEAALFVQQTSAESAVKKIRKAGKEPEGAPFEVVGIQFNAVEINEKRKTGYILMHKGAGIPSYYNGPKTIVAVPTRIRIGTFFGDRAADVTMFSTTKAAGDCLIQLKMDQIYQAQRLRKDGVRVSAEYAQAFKRIESDTAFLNDVEVRSYII